jgi:hypothetical protein
MNYRFYEVRISAARLITHSKARTRSEKHYITIVLSSNMKFCNAKRALEIHLIDVRFVDDQGGTQNDFAATHLDRAQASSLH